jgi:hypothetical protein
MMLPSSRLLNPSTSSDIFSTQEDMMPHEQVASNDEDVDAPDNEDTSYS